MRCATLLFLALAVTSLAPCQGDGLRSGGNPIRKVVTMLQAMQQKVEEEGKTEKELYDKFMCYCQSGVGDLKKSIAEMEDKVSALNSDYKAAEAKEVQSGALVRQSQVERDAAHAALKEAMAIREKEHKAYVAYRDDAKVNHAVVVKAIEALEKGMGNSFLQTNYAQILHRLAEKADADTLIEEDRQELLSFLEGSADNEYAPQSGGILGILKQMGDSMSKGLRDAGKAEDDAMKAHLELINAKTKEMKALEATVEQKMEEVGDLGVQIVEMRDDLADTEKALRTDKKFARELTHGCSTKTAEWEKRQKTRAEELSALADTIKALNDDDALDLFKKALPSAAASLLQVTETSKAVRSRAMNALHSAKNHALKENKANLGLLALALAGKKSMTQGGLDKVIKMCDEMINMLSEEQQADDRKVEYCTRELDASEDKKKTLDRTVSKEHKALATTKEALATTIDEIEALKAGIVKLDRSVAEATDQRKQENAEYKELMAQDTAAAKLLTFARDRLSKFYKPKKGESFISVDLVPTLVQVSMRKAAPGPPPETWGAYTKGSTQSHGVISMIEVLLTDLEKDIQEAAGEEKVAQHEYEMMMQESTEKRTADSTSLTDKTTAKADMETEIEEHKADKYAAQKDAMAAAKFISNLHGGCDWLMQYHEARKEARVGELDAVKKAKAVLSGADYSLVQTKVRTFLHRGKKMIA